MVIKYFSFFIIIFLSSCQDQKDSQKIVNAKWFYYAFAMDQNGYNDKGDKIDPLKCDIKLNAIDHTVNDTTKFFFTLYQKDTLDICFLKPFNLVGMMLVAKSNLYVPIYHDIVMSKHEDNIILDKMNNHSSLLMRRCLEPNSGVNFWLKGEAEKRR